jgi:histidinol-phosphate aminotransferase
LRSPSERSHGGLIDRELAALGLSSIDVLDVSVNTNPYGPHPSVLAAMRAVAIDRYPDPTAWNAREAIARATNARADHVVLGNGAVDLLWTLVRTLLAPGRTAVVVEPAFSEFGAAVEAAGGRLVAWRAFAEDGFAVRLDEVAGLARRTEAELVYICNPANPTGIGIDLKLVDDFARSSPSLIVVLDESFTALSEHADDEHHALPENVVRVRSMTKTHTLPGVRVGYLLAREDLAARVECARPPWTTSAFAQAAAIAASSERAFIDDSRARVLADRVRTTRALRTLGFDPLPSSTVFFLVPVRDAAATRTRMLTRHRVLVRDCTSFGLARYVRICARPSADEDRLLTAFREEAAT